MLKIILGIVFGLFLLLLVAALSLFGCFRKKTPAKKDVESELELLFPGKFQVLHSNLKMLDVVAMYKGDKQAVIGDKADPDVQFLLDWSKGVESAGFDSSTVIAAHEHAKNEVSKTRELVKLLQANGLKDFSAGLRGSFFYVQVFAEPDAKRRLETLKIIQSVLPDLADQEVSKVCIELLEPEAFHRDYQEVIPGTHWKMGAGMQEDMKILTLDMDTDSRQHATQWSRHWVINLVAKRFQETRKEAYKSASAWAEKNLAKPYFMSEETYLSYEPLEAEEPSIRLGFPYYDRQLSEEEKLQSGNDAKGFVTCVYQFDQKVFTQLRKQAEF